MPPSSITGKEKADVTVDVDLLSILEIVEVDFVISLQLNVQLRWMDTRLFFNNLHGNPSLNTLTTEFKDQIWLPQVN